MSKTNAERLNELYKTYDLTAEDVFKSPQGWKIITRNGIDKIQAKAGIDISYEIEMLQPDFVVIKAKGQSGGKKIETFGEANNGNHKPNCRQNYIVAMAEKRAMSRVVLKLTGFYELGVMGEDEADDFGAEAKKHRQNIKSTL